MTASRARLVWSVKDSFLGYIRRLDDGLIETFDGCEAGDDAYVFPIESSDETGTLCSGGIRFTGFAGMLDVRIVDPMIENTSDGLRLSALVGPESIAARVAIATIDETRGIRPGEPWTATPRLTFEGVRVFGDVYQVGEELAPLVIEPVQR
jgi:hypothetical protein